MSVKFLVSKEIIIPQIRFVGKLIAVKKFKFLLIWIPEIYFIVSSLYYWLLTSQLLNPVATLLVLVLTTQILLKNKAIGIITSVVFIFY